MTEGLLPPHPLSLRAGRWGGRLLATSSGARWGRAVTGALVLGGAAAGLRLPAAGVFGQLAGAEEISRFGVHAHFMAQAAPLDLRTWLSDFLALGVERLGGVGLLELLGALLGAGLGLLLAWGGRRAGAHPLALALGGGAALLGLSQLPATLSTYWLALLAAALLLLLRELAAGRRGALVGIVLLCALWANLEAAAVLVPELLLLHWAAARLDRRARLVGSAPPLLLVPLAWLATLLNPQGILLYGRLPLSLGQGGENPLLTLWSSPDFHTWSMRLVELAALVLLAGYLLAGPRLLRQEALLGMLAAAASLLWVFYLPLLVAVVGVQAPVHLSSRLDRAALREPRPRRGVLPWAAALPLLVALALLARPVAGLAEGGGPARMLARQLPVAAAGWLDRHPAPGAWYTSADFGDYLAARFPRGQHLICTTNAVADSAQGLAACHRLGQLNSGVMGILARHRARLAVLPRADPGVAFLAAQGWRTRYRDRVAVVMAPPPSRG